MEGGREREREGEREGGREEGREGERERRNKRMAEVGLGRDILCGIEFSRA